MDPLALAARIAAIEGRRPGSDAERRAALTLAGALRGVSRRRRRTTVVETFWIRPHHAAVHAALAALAVAGSVVSLERPVLGLALVAAALALLAGDLTGRFALPRLLTWERATQNVVAHDPREAGVRLVVTAAIDAPAPGLLGRGAPARLQTRVRRRLRGHLPGPYGVLTGVLTALVACTLARVLGGDGPVLDALQLVPTALTVLAVGVGLDAATAAPREADAGASAAAAAVAVGLIARLDADPPAGLAVDCVLAGAGSAHALGFRRWLREQRRAGVRAEDVVVLHVAPCFAGGRLVSVERDGLVLALRAHPRLVGLARRAGLTAHAARGMSAARAARALRWPAIALGCVEGGPTAQPDVTGAPDPIPAVLDACEKLVRGLDAELGSGGSTAPLTAVRGA